KNNQPHRFYCGVDLHARNIFRSRFSTFGFSIPQSTKKRRTETPLEERESGHVLVPQQIRTTAFADELADSDKRPGLFHALFRRMRRQLSVGDISPSQPSGPWRPVRSIAGLDFALFTKGT